MKMAAHALAFSIVLASSAGAAEVIDSTQVAAHQRCVFQAFAQELQQVRTFDPDLLNKSVGKCEAMLRPLRDRLMGLTRDASFADQVLTRIREASRRGVAVAVIAYFGSQEQL